MIPKLPSPDFEPGQGRKDHARTRRWTLIRRNLVGSKSRLGKSRLGTVPPRRSQRKALLTSGKDRHHLYDQPGQLKASFAALKTVGESGVLVRCDPISKHDCNLL